MKATLMRMSAGMVIGTGIAELIWKNPLALAILGIGIWMACMTGGK